MDEIKKVEFEIVKLEARMLQFERIARVLELSDEQIENKTNEMLDQMTELIRKRNKLKE